MFKLSYRNSCSRPNR